MSNPFVILAAVAFAMAALLAIVGVLVIIGVIRGILAERRASKL